MSAGLYSVRQFCRDLGIAPSTHWRWEKTPDRSTLKEGAGQGSMDEIRNSLLVIHVDETGRRQVHGRLTGVNHSKSRIENLQ
jgi:hypothetical protein